MALHLNLLHEEITEQRQRQRDPLKIGTKALAGIGVLMLSFTFSKPTKLSKSKTASPAFSANGPKWSRRHRGAKTHGGANAIVGTTKVLDAIVDERFSGPRSCSASPAASRRTLSSPASPAPQRRRQNRRSDHGRHCRRPRTPRSRRRTAPTLERTTGRKYAGVKVEFKIARRSRHSGQRRGHEHGHGPLHHLHQL